MFSNARTCTQCSQCAFAELDDQPLCGEHLLAAPDNQTGTITRDGKEWKLKTKPGPDHLIATLEAHGHNSGPVAFRIGATHNPGFEPKGADPLTDPNLVPYLDHKRTEAHQRGRPGQRQRKEQ